MQVKAYVDGGCLRNGQPDAFGYGSMRVIGRVDQTIRWEFPTVKTNNVAEYHALISALEFIDLAIQHCAWEGEILVMMDSKLVINQIKGVDEVKADHLKPLVAQARTLLGTLLASGVDIELRRISGNDMKKMLGH